MAGGNELISTYSELGFGAFMSMLTAGIIVYVILRRFFEGIFRRNFSSGWRYALALVIPVVFLVPVKLAAPWSVIPLINLNFPLYIKSPDPIVVEGITETKRFFTDAEATGEFLYDALFYVWLAGFVITLAYQIIKLWKFSKKVRESSIPCADTMYKNMLEGICNENKMPVPRLVVFPGADTPFAMGMRSPCIILPAEKYSEREIAYILRHELTHIRRGDIVIKLLLMVFRCLNWFNPFAYIMCKRAYEDMEITCDERAARGFSHEEREEYSKTILRGVSKQSYPAVTTYLSPTAKLTKKRIDAVMTVKKLGGLIPFAVGFLSIAFVFSLFYAFPDKWDKGFYFYTDPYPMEADPYFCSDGWRTCEADSPAEAGERIFRQYMDMYTGEDIPDYYRIEDYCINNVRDVLQPDKTIELNSLFLPVAKGLFTPQKYVEVTYSFRTANQCGNTVHDKHFGMSAYVNGAFSDSIMCFELEKKGRTYTVTNIGTVGMWGVTRFHFENYLTGGNGILPQAEFMAQSGLLDYSWNDSDALPDPNDVCEYMYKREKFNAALLNDNIDENSDVPVPMHMSFCTSTNITNEHISKADCIKTNAEGIEIIDSDKLVYDESRGFEYCGYDFDTENGNTVIYGNVTGENAHGVKLIIYSEKDKAYTRKLHGVEISHKLFTPYVFRDSFGDVSFPENITSAEDRLEYMKTPREGVDFTVLDYRNITEEKGSVYAEVKFKGRLEGIYSSDLSENDDNEYIKVRIV